MKFQPKMFHVSNSDTKSIVYISSSEDECKVKAGSLNVLCDYARFVVEPHITPEIATPYLTKREKSGLIYIQLPPKSKPVSSSKPPTLIPDAENEDTSVKNRVANYLKLIKT